MIRVNLGQLVREAVEQAVRVGVTRSFKHTHVPKAVERNLERIVEQADNEFAIALAERGIELGDIEIAHTTAELSERR